MSMSSNRFLMSVAAIALIAGAGAANAQGMNRESGGAAMQHGAPSGTAATPAGHDSAQPSGGSSEMKSEQSAPGAAKGQRAEESAPGQKYINNYVINQIFKFQILAIKLYTQNKCINQILNNI